MKAIYNKDKSHRIIQRGKLWFLQSRVSRPEGSDTKVHHGWVDESRGMDYETAIGRLV